MKIKFNIVNFYKENSLYENGLKPVVFSERHYMSTQQGWHRDCTDISYTKNELKKMDVLRQQQQQSQQQNLGFQKRNSDYSSDHKKKNKYNSNNNNNSNNVYLTEAQIQQLQQPFYTLSFTYTFNYSNDLVYFAHCYPYTYTDLSQYLQKLKKAEKQTQFFQVSTLGKTIIGNSIHCITVTNNIYHQQPLFKKCICITGRVHPGETNSSWVMKGIIDFLISNDHRAQKLRDLYIFKLIPMLNPDGVRYGNYRCCVFGNDLNRKWKKPNLLTQRPIAFVKQLIKEVQQEREVFLVCDVHGHSKNQNVFMYGCYDKEEQQQQQQQLQHSQYQQQLLQINQQQQQYQQQQLLQQQQQYGVTGGAGASIINTTNSNNGFSTLTSATINNNNNNYSPLNNSNNVMTTTTTTTSVSNATITAVQEKNLNAKMFPYLFSQRKEYFDFSKCLFALQKKKSGTARIVCWNEYNIVRSYTLECSFMGFGVYGQNSGGCCNNYFGANNNNNGFANSFGNQQQLLYTNNNNNCSNNNHQQNKLNTQYGDFLQVQQQQNISNFEDVGKEFISTLFLINDEQMIKHASMIILQTYKQFSSLQIQQQQQQQQMDQNIWEEEGELQEDEEDDLMLQQLQQQQQQSTSNINNNDQPVDQSSSIALDTDKNNNNNTVMKEPTTIINSNNNNSNSNNSNNKDQQQQQQQQQQQNGTITSSGSQHQPQQYQPISMKELIAQFENISSKLDLRHDCNYQNQLQSGTNQYSYDTSRQEYLNGGKINSFIQSNNNSSSRCNSAHKCNIAEIQNPNNNNIIIQGQEMYSNSQNQMQSSGNNCNNEGTFQQQQKTTELDSSSNNNSNHPEKDRQNQENMKIGLKTILNLQNPQDQNQPLMNHQQQYKCSEKFYQPPKASWNVFNFNDQSKNQQAASQKLSSNINNNNSNNINSSNLSTTPDTRLKVLPMHSLKAVALQKQRQFLQQQQKHQIGQFDKQNFYQTSEQQQLLQSQTQKHHNQFQQQQQQMLMQQQQQQHNFLNSSGGGGNNAGTGSNNIFLKYSEKEQSLMSIYLKSEPAVIQQKKKLHQQQQMQMFYQGKVSAFLTANNTINNNNNIIGMQSKVGLEEYSSSTQNGKTAAEQQQQQQIMLEEQKLNNQQYQQDQDLQQTLSIKQVVKVVRSPNIIVQSKKQQPTPPDEYSAVHQIKQGHGQLLIQSKRVVNSQLKEMEEKMKDMSANLIIKGNSPN